MHRIAVACVAMAAIKLWLLYVSCLYSLAGLALSSHFRGGIIQWRPATNPYNGIVSCQYVYTTVTTVATCRLYNHGWHTILFAIFSVLHASDQTGRWEGPGTRLIEYARTVIILVSANLVFLQFSAVIKSCATSAQEVQPTKLKSCPSNAV